MRAATISAVLLNYNDASYLSQALEGITRQTVPFDELIIVDDGSTDESIALITKHIENIPYARLVRHSENLGVVSAVNTGMKEATADFLFYMSTNDAYSPSVSQWCRDALALYPNAALISGNTRIRDEGTRSEQLLLSPFPQQVGCYTSADLEKVAKKFSFVFNGGATLIRRDVMLALGGQNPAMKWYGDWLINFLTARRHSFAIVPEEFICIRRTNGQYSSGCHDWQKQRPVIEAFFEAITNEHAKEYEFFRRCAILPAYDFQTLFLLFANGKRRSYITPLLLWRLLTYKPLRAIGRKIPGSWVAKLRPLLRV